MKMNVSEMIADTMELPFNRGHLDNEFVFSAPDRDPGGSGFWLLMHGMTVLMVATDHGLDMPFGQCPVAAGESALYIGQWQGSPCRVLAVRDTTALPESLISCHLRAPDQPLPLALLSLAGMGQAILHWEGESRCCGNCGGVMVRLPGEYGKKCSVCATQHYPRIHPCVIGLVIKGDELLLTHKAEWTDGRYGLVAGFVEFGECLEEAMAREVYEETNIRINNIRYIGSQAWPFPSQLMCGFVADYVSGDVKLNDQELADARWFKISELPTIPPKRSIARFLIDHARQYIAG